MLDPSFNIIGEVTLIDKNSLSSLRNFFGRFRRGNYKKSKLILAKYVSTLDAISTAPGVWILHETNMRLNLPHLWMNEKDTKEIYNILCHVNLIFRCMKFKTEKECFDFLESLIYELIHKENILDELEEFE